MKLAIAKRREEARLKKEAEERAKREKAEAEQRHLEEIKRKRAEEIKRRREENNIKVQQEKQQQELQRKQEIEQQEEFIKQQQEQFKKGREISRQRKEKEEEEERARKEAEREMLEQAEETLRLQVLERKRLLKEQEDARRAEEETLRKEKEERELAAAEEQKRVLQARIEAAKEEARKKREAEEREKLEARRAADEEQQRIIQERARLIEEARIRNLEQKEHERLEKIRLEEENKRQLEEQEQQRKARRAVELQEQRRLAQEREEQAKRDEAERAKRVEEELREARKRHKEAVRLQKQQEFDEEAEEARRQEAIRAKAFEEEQERRRVELEQGIQQEESRRKKREELQRQSGSGNASPINRCGLFANFGEEIGLEIWVIGDNLISKIAKKKHGLRGLIGESHGSFHVEKAYVVLHTSYSNGVYHYKLYLWLGSQCPAEMMKQAHERFEELQRGLEHEDIQHVGMELERQESPEFLQYFDKALEYVEAVNLRETEGPNLMEKRMYWIKGRHNVRCKLVPAVPDSLNSGDVFILEDTYGIYQFNGRKSNKMERGKALDFGVQLRIERNARCRVTLIDEADHDNEHERNKFWATLLLDRDTKTGEFIVPDSVRTVRDSGEGVTGATPVGLEQPIRSELDSGDDREHEVNYIESWKLYKVGPINPPDASSSSTEDLEKLPLETIHLDIPRRGPTVDMLCEWNCYVLDCDTEIFMWYGNTSTHTAREQCKQKAKHLAEGRSFVRLTKVRQRTEPYIFREKFLGNWGNTFTDFEFNPDVRGNIAQLKQEEINIDCMYHPEKYEIASEDTRMPIPNRGEGQVDSFTFKVFLIHQKQQVPLSEEEYGQFWSANCYIIIYERRVGDLTRNVVYFWQGYHSSHEDRGISALMAGNIAKNLRFCQVRHVEQNKEPDHFVSHFSAMIVRVGKRNPAKLSLTSGSHLYHVRGTNEVNVFAIETSRDVHRLNSNNAFVFVHENTVFVWTGAYANEYERKAASTIAQSIPDAKVVPLEEGHESDAFWSALDANGTDSREYYKAKNHHSGILFECTNAIGIFKVYRVDDFSQHDLISRNCIILDGHDKIFVWIGGEANEKCVEMTKDTAHKYVKFQDDTVSVRDAEIVVCHAGKEPLEFTCYFHSWDSYLSRKSVDSKIKLHKFFETN